MSKINPLDLLKQVNTEVNKETYVSDEGLDDWTPIVPGQGGDCDSYATTKMQRLFDAGWPLKALRLATCWTETGGYHCVLLADLDGQAWVLDNRQPYPIEAQLLDYKWDKLQVAGTQQWITEKDL